MDTTNKHSHSHHRISKIIRRIEYIYLGFFTVFLNILFLLRPFLTSWNYWPEWGPISRTFVAGFSQILCLLYPLLFGFGIIAFVVFGDSVRRNISDLLRKKLPPGILFLLLFVVILALSVTYVFQSRQEIVDFFVRKIIVENHNIPLENHSDIDSALIAFAASRYDPVINAIEKYHSEYGEYPPDLETLVPAFLDTPPGIYMKFGEYLSYSPVVEGQHYDHSPFKFELYGHYSPEFLHGQTLKYCPIEIDPCFDGNRHFTPIRINKRWILVYSSAL